MFGALAVGTVFATQDKRTTARRGFLLFAVALSLFASAPNVPLAFVTGFLLGTTYFSTTTALMTVLQSRLELQVRARVLSLWFMAFGGTIPIGNIIFGPVMDAIGARPVLYFGAAWALFLSWWCNIHRIDMRAAEDASFLAAGIDPDTRT
jgi:predicted MFS family arabinose efflux permease